MAVGVKSSKMATTGVALIKIAAAIVKTPIFGRSPTSAERCLFSAGSEPVATGTRIPGRSGGTGTLTSKIATVSCVQTKTPARAREVTSGVVMGSLRTAKDPRGAGLP